MVAPIIKKPKETITWSNVQGQFLWEQDGYKQAKPYDKVTAYSSRYAVCTRSGTGKSVSIIWDWISQIGTWDSWTNLNNRVYSKFKGKLLSEAQLGVSIVEWRQSYEMITHRAGQLLQAARAVRRFQFGKAAKILKMAFIPKGVSRHKAFGRNWLEFWFGWSASIGDIYSAIDVLQQPPLPMHFKTSVVEGKTYILSQTIVDNPSATYPASNINRTWTKWIVKRGMACGCKLELSNENEFLANQLGLRNPASIAWEAVPFSWLLDWVANVGDVLESLTDFHGLTLSEAWTSKFVKGQLEYQNYNVYSWWEGNPPHRVYGGGMLGRANGPFSQTNRSLGLPTPILSIRPIHLSKSRAATAISLLLQGLGSDGPGSKPPFRRI